MIQYIASHAFKFFVRVVILLVADFSLARTINTELGYRMDFKALFLCSVIAIVAIRVWMPWRKE